jgi:hypothetical protein
VPGGPKAERGSDSDSDAARVLDWLDWLGVIGVIGGQQRAMKRRPPVAPQVGPVSIPRPRPFTPPGRCGAAIPPIVSLRPALIKHSPFLSSPPSPPSPPPDQRSTSLVSASAPPSHSCPSFTSASPCRATRFTPVPSTPSSLVDFHRQRLARHQDLYHAHGPALTSRHLPDPTANCPCVQARPDNHHFNLVNGLAHTSPD